MARPIYLDNHATTAVDPRVLEAMLPTFCEAFGNAGSGAHAQGWEALALVDRAREQVAALLGSSPEEIVFTSGATESNNLAILGSLPEDPAGSHVVTAATEHPAVLETCSALQRRGARLSVLAVDAAGRVDPRAVAAALEPATVLVSIMAANNEVGTLNPISEIAAACAERGVRFHCDAAQAVGRVPLDVVREGVDLLSLSGHKFHGPKGVGALHVRRGGGFPPLRAQQHGGGQERGRRPGTLNVSGIVGLGAAAAVAAEELPAEAARIGALRDRLQGGLQAELDGLSVNGASGERLPGNLSLTVAGVEAEALVLALPELAISTGSACSTGSAAPSHVLRALGLSEEQARSTLRFGLARFTTETEVSRALELVIAAVRRLRSDAPV